MLEIGQTLGNYRIIGKIGEGGMGAVFAAIHDQIGRHVAIKVLHSQFARDPGVAQRFLNEARAVNRVKHPGIVEIYDLGQLEDGSAFIVMELLRGETLTARLASRGGRLDLQEVLPIFRQLAAVLVAAHENGVVHRDMKPDNVMIVPDPPPVKAERAKLLDFGIARVASDAGGDRAQAVTRTGALLGTPLYMAPEQCMGRRHIDGQADVYAMGAMVFHLLAGRPPFLCEDGGLGGLLAKHVYETPPALATIVPGLPPQLTDLIDGMLRKEPGARPSITQVSQVLDLGAELWHERKDIALFGAKTAVSKGNVPAYRTRVLQLIGALVGSAVFLFGLNTGIKSGNGRQLLGRAGQILLAHAGHVAREKPSRETVEPEVLWEIRSNPAGAQIIRLHDGAVLGVTPWLQRVRQEPGVVVIRVRKPGYAEEMLVHDLAKSEKQSIYLRPLPTTASRQLAAETLRSQRTTARLH